MGSVWTLLAAAAALISLMNMVQSAPLPSVLLSRAAGVVLAQGFLKRRGPADALAVALAYTLNVAASIGAAAEILLLSFLSLMIVWNKPQKRQS